MPAKQSSVRVEGGTSGSTTLAINGHLAGPSARQLSVDPDLTVPSPDHDHRWHAAHEQVDEHAAMRSQRSTVERPRSTADAHAHGRRTFRASTHTRNLAQVIGASGFICEREGSDTAKITTPAEPQGVQLTDHLDDIWPSKGDALTEHLEPALHGSLRLVPET